MPAVFDRVKFYVIDEFHRWNHKCSKRVLNAKEKKRMVNVPTNMSESFNAWMRPFNFSLNSMRPDSHRFWVQEAISFWNETNCDFFRPKFWRRTSASSRASGRRN